MEDVTRGCRYNGRMAAQPRTPVPCFAPPRRMPPARPPWVGCEEPSVNDQLRADHAARGDATETLRLSSSAASHVEAYLEYRRVVGNADGGVLLSGQSGLAARVPASRLTLRRQRRSTRASASAQLSAPPAGCT